MKRIILTVAIILSVAVALTANVCGANQPVKPLRDYLLQPPNSTMQLYGWSEETFRLYNVVAIMQLAQRNETQIRSLRSEVTSLRTEIAKLKEALKNLEALVKVNATITTLITADMADDIPTMFSDPNDLKETRTGRDK